MKRSKNNLIIKRTTWVQKKSSKQTNFDFPHRKLLAITLTKFNEHWCCFATILLYGDGNPENNKIRKMYENQSESQKVRDSINFNYSFSNRNKWIFIDFSQLSPSIFPNRISLERQYICIFTAGTPSWGWWALNSGI